MQKIGEPTIFVVEKEDFLMQWML